MMWQMACTGAKWCDFVSYDPRMPESMRFFCKRIERDNTVIRDLDTEVKAFLKELDRKIDDLNAIYRKDATS